MTTLTLKRDSNGNKVLQVKPDTGRAFSIQTLGNLPTAHSMLTAQPRRGSVLIPLDNARFQGVACSARAANDGPVYVLAWNELQRHVKQHGTARQKAMLCIE